jgi:hypothetical protein
MILSLEQLNRAHFHVLRELGALGLWSERLAQVEVLLVPFSWDCYGWQNYGSDGSICVPQLCVARVGDWWFKRKGYPLRDLLRHEWAHALAHHYPELISSRSFVRAFDGEHDGEDSFLFDPEIHVSEYAATSPMEDFAENFMGYLKHKGHLPQKWQTPSIAKRWRFIGGLAGKVGRLRETW